MPFAVNSVTVSKAARLLGMAPTTLKRLLVSGAIRYIETKGSKGRKLIHVGEIDRYQRFGAFDPCRIEEQTNAQENHTNQKASQVSQIRGSEIFQDQNQPDYKGTTLPTDNQAGYAQDQPRRAVEHRVRDNREQEADSPSHSRVSGEPTKQGGDTSSGPGNVEEEARVPLDEVEESDRANQVGKE